MNPQVHLITHTIDGKRGLKYLEDQGEKSSHYPVGNVTEEKKKSRPKDPIYFNKTRWWWYNEDEMKDEE